MRPPALSLYRPLEGARYRVVAFPHAGGGASAFRGLKSALAAHGIDLCPLQPPGRENRVGSPPHQSALDLAREFAAAVSTLPVGPTAFLGHSLGGLVAYLTARLLAGSPAAPRHLVVSGSLAPTLRPRRDLGDAPDLPERIMALGGIPEAIAAEPDLLALFMAVIRADIRMGERLPDAPFTPLDLPITVWTGDRDRSAPPHLAPHWADLTRRPLRLRPFEGGHFFLYADPAFSAACLVEDLAAGASGPASQSISINPPD